MRYAVGFFLLLLIVLAATWAGTSEDSSSNDPDPAPTATAVPDDETVSDPAATATPAPTPTPPGPDRITMVFTGEILSHSPVIRQAGVNGPGETYDYVPMFAEVAPLLEAADFAVCHVETPISDDNRGLNGYPVFLAPQEMAAGIKASGYDACSTASNHSLDALADGVVTTLDQLEAAGLPWAGMARSAEEKATPTLYDIHGVTIGHLSYTYGLNGYSMPADRPYLVNVTSAEAVLDEAARAKAAGADFVVLSIQWGAEYQHNPTASQVDLATTLLASPDIDLIVGAHVHVVQPVDNINGKWVAYGVGNQLSNQSTNAGLPDATQNGIMLFVEVTGTDADGYAVSDISFVPTRVDRSDYTIVPLPNALTDPALDANLRAQYERVIEVTTEVVNRRGADLAIGDAVALGVGGD